MQLQGDRIIACVHAQPVVRCSALHQVHLLKRTTRLVITFIAMRSEYHCRICSVSQEPERSAEQQMLGSAEFFHKDNDHVTG